MIRRFNSISVWLVAAMFWLVAGASARPGFAADEVKLVDQTTPWRVFIAPGPNLVRTAGGHLEFSEFGPDEFERMPRDRRLPPRDWTTADFDDFHWPQYQPDELGDFIGGIGARPMSGRGTWLTTVSLRTHFGIGDPNAVDDLKITVKCLGGGVVYVNGVEVGRGYMPEGELHAVTPARDYPKEAYVDEHDAPLPRVGIGERPEAEWADRYARRIRTFTVTVPRNVLRQGSNVLAVDLRRAPTTGSIDDQWDHVGFHEITVSGRGGGVVEYRKATSRTYVCNVPAEQQISETIPTRSLIARGWHWTLTSARGMPVKGVSLGNPFEPERPMRLSAPRNGTGSAQVLVCDRNGLKNVSARLRGDLRGPGRATMPADAVDIRYAARDEQWEFLNALMPEAPRDVPVVPVWLIVQVPAGQQPGWYQSQLEIQANDETFTVPVQVLVTGYRMPDPRDFPHVTIGMTQSPGTLAMQYDVEPWSDEHWRLIEASLKLLGQLGDSVVEAPVILSNFPAAGRADRPPGRSSDSSSWHLPLVRWIDTDDGIRPDMRILDKYLDLYVKHVGKPQAISLWLWDPASAEEIAGAHERPRYDSREVRANPAQVMVLNPRTGETRLHTAPSFLADDAEAFWKPMLDAVRDTVKRREWSERIITLGLGSDIRAGRRTGERFREWAPYARWDLLSHYSGETPGRLDDGRYIATGALEMGVRRYPWMALNNVFEAERLERLLERSEQTIELPTARWMHQPYSPPFLFRMLPQFWGHLGHMGIDFWRPGGEGPSNTSFFAHINALTAPGPDGAVPTIQFQMLREGIQDFELRMAIVQAVAGIDDLEKKNRYHRLVDELRHRISWSHAYLSMHELGYDYPTYAARIQRAAAELNGESSDARWSQPPAR
ncbi:MAG: hypothetical protein JJU36_01975 [Phycisphaeraceae bacterium]|nr:hypothetical protein [Phycisphaeraceae bacterium]